MLKEKTFTSHFATLYIMVRAVDLHFFPSLYQNKTDDNLMLVSGELHNSSSHSQGVNTTHVAISHP